MKKLFAAALSLLLAMSAFGQSYPSPTYNVLTLQTPLALTSGGTAASTASQARTNLGLGTAATQNTGTSGATVPLLNGANTWSATQTFSVRPTFNGATPWDSANLPSPAQTTGTLAQFASTTSAQLAGVISDETGTGSAVFATSPTLAGTPLAPTATTGTNTTQIATTAFVNASITASATSGRLIGIQVFSASGTYTPDTGTNSVIVRIMGGGGAGGGAAATSSSQTSCGAGGGAGGYIEHRMTSGFSGATVTVGSGGTGVSGATGGNGGSSSFAGITAGGGVGGSSAAAASATNVGAAGGGTATGGSILNAPGQPGSGAFVAASAANFLQPIGAGSQLGGGGAAASPNATGFGSGGAGMLNGPSSAASAGGNGAKGIVIVYEFS